MRTAYILGAGLTGLTIADILKERYEVVMIDKNNFIGGLCNTHKCQGVEYEFGPHILYTNTRDQRKWWEARIVNYIHNYIVRLSIDGKLKSSSLYDFPISTDNLLRLGDFNLNKTPNPNAETFEDYLISCVGEKAYDAFIKNYNIKQWGLDPSQMIAEWAKFRPLTLREEPTPLMFGTKWAGHPINYNQFFEDLSQDIDIELNCKYLGHQQDPVDKSIDKIFYKGFSKLLGEGTKKRLSVKKDDIVINTFPVDLFSTKLLHWRGILKRYVLLDGKELMPTYSTTFPNTYSWTRICSYTQQSFVDSDKTLISFAVPYTNFDAINQDQLNVEIRQFIKEELKDATILDQFDWAEDRVYPVSNKYTPELIDSVFREISEIPNFYTCGRLGLFAYISMARAVEIARETAYYVLDHIFEKSTPEERFKMYMSQRSELW